MHIHVDNKFTETSTPSTMVWIAALGHVCSVSFDRRRGTNNKILNTTAVKPTTIVKCRYQSVILLIIQLHQECDCFFPTEEERLWTSFQGFLLKMSAYEIRKESLEPGE